jgi:hypothetical protein
MSWFKVALGLISTAVGTETGREVISSVRSAIRKDDPQPGPPSAGLNIEEVQALIARHRADVDRNLETVIQTVNAQNQKLAAINRRLWIWNILLTLGVVIVLIWSFMR